jgi:hypothetical protein
VQVNSGGSSFGYEGYGPGREDKPPGAAKGAQTGGLRDTPQARIILSVLKGTWRANLLGLLQLFEYDRLNDLNIDRIIIAR